MKHCIGKWNLTFGRISTSVDFVLCYKNSMFAVHNKRESLCQP